MIGVDSGEILAEAIINPSASFLPYLPVNRTFLCYCCFSGCSRHRPTFYGTPGGLLQPQTFNPSPNQT